MRKTIFKSDDWMPGIDNWNEFKTHKPEDSELCVVEFLDYIDDENGGERVYDYEVRFFVNTTSGERNWWDVRRWKYLYE